RLWMASSLTVAGNSGLFAGYALLGIGISLYLAIPPGRHRPLYLTAAAMEVVALIVSENRSSVLGLLVGAVAGAMILGSGTDRENRRWIPLWLALGGAALVASLVAVVRLPGGEGWTSRLPAVFRKFAATDFGGIDALRAMQWEAALAGFMDRPLLGFGPENYQLVWSAHFDPRSRALGAEVFDRTHNQYAEMLATTGIVGALAFAGIWLAIGYSLYSAFTARRIGVRELAVLSGANIAYATYLIFWFVDISAAILWLLLAAVIARRCNPLPILRVGEPRLPLHVGSAGVLITGIALAFLLHRHAYAPARASFALATLDSPRVDDARASAALDVISGSSSPQTSHFGPVLSNFIDASISDAKPGGLRREGRTALIDRAFETAISAYDAELKRDPLNDRLHTSAAELLMDAAEFYGSMEHLERAVGLLERAVELSPLRSRQQRLLAEASSDLLLFGGEGEMRR
ncbi:MAG TPA: O-antigen ligase family protein, partial [Gemmatimonadaceae bacterium]|nr:O-antigen ligase family protein [Gemmatimonadaceae bacterium]